MKNVIAVVVLILAIFFYFFFTTFTPFSIIENDGYALVDNKVAENLFKTNINEYDVIVEPIKVQAFDSLYSGQGKLFVGETKKTSINSTFPLFTNDSLAVINLSSESVLIDSYFKKYEGYPNFTLTSGELYNKDDNTRADNNNYLFLQLANMLLLNSKSIAVKTDIKDYKIPMNSIISFTEDTIKYYYFYNDIFIYNKIADIDMDSIITIEDTSYTYESLLINLGIISVSQDEIPDIDTPDIPDEPEEPEKPYQKPIVKCETFATNVYSVRSSLSINDSARVISTPIMFEVRADGKLYLRKAYLSSGGFEIIGLAPSTTYEIKGTFKYTNEDSKEIQETIINQTVTTKGIETLTPITLSFNNGDIFPSKMEVIKLKIAEGLDSETIKGIKKIAVKINGDTYKMNSSNFNSLLKGEEITYTSPENLPSNTNIDYEIMLTDNYNNNATVINNKKATRTSKQIPKATIKVEKNDILEIALKVTLNNKDNTAIQNYRYVVSTSNNKIIASDYVPKDGVIKLHDLNASELFAISVYADYDIEDGKGVKKDQILGEAKFTSIPITSLGYVRLNIELKEVLQNTVSMNINIDNTSTDNRLVTLLKELKVNIIEKTDSSEEVIYSQNVVDIDKLKLGETVLETISNLNSSTTYYIRIDSIVMQGDKEYNLETLINNKSFTTLKREANVLIRNSFSTKTMIDFDVKIEDLDASILNDNIRLEVRDIDGKIARAEKLKINDDYVRLTYDKLKENTYYTFNYIVDEYNIGHDNSTFEDNYVIESYKVYTTEGINGSIGTVSLLERQRGKNLFDINNLIRWKSNGIGSDEKSISATNNTISLTALNGYHNYSYYLIDYISKRLTISFYAKRVEGDAPAYIANSDGDATTYLLSNLGSEYQKYTYTLTLNTKGYLGFNIREVLGKNLRTTIMIKDLQIEEGTNATAYEQFITSSTYDASMTINLYDTKNEITNNKYYVNVYKENILEETYEYDIDDTNNVMEKINSYSLTKNSTYKLELTVKIRDREYAIASTSFTTEKEIRSIKTVTDFFRIHNNGRYVVIEDLNFQNNGNVYGSPFYGEIDFQGHSVTIAAQNGPSYLFENIGSTGIIKNIDLHVYLNNVLERSYYYGLNYQNYGTIKNIMVTIEEATAVPNVVMGTMSYVNYGTIDSFVINSKASIYGSRFLSTGVIHNYGLMKNGYAYGEPIIATFPNFTEGAKRVGSITAYAGNNSRIENVYSLIAIKSIDDGNNKQVGILVGENNRGFIQNSYTVGDLDIDNTSGDVTVGYVSNTINATNLFYAANRIYTASYSQKVSSLAIRDAEFQDKVLNKENQFMIEGLVNNGYYPQLVMPDCMPYQELIPLMEVEDSDLIDITSTEVLESNTDSIKVLFNIHNPSSERITTISIKDASIRILSQEDSRGKTKLIGIVENPIKYLSKYYVKSITSVGAFGIVYTRNYANNERALYFDLYRPVNNIADWKRIKESPSENYQLTTNLDFMYETNYLIGNFNGKLNGNNHTLSNIEISSGNGLITTLNGEIKNLFVVNYKKTNASAYGGLIYNSVNISTIDNVHMTNVYVNGTSYIGGIIGYGSGTIIRNSSVTNFKNITDSELSDVRIGGIAGYLTSGYIQNSFVQKVNIDIRNAISTYGIGGIVGQLEGGVLENCYATGNIKNSSNMTGGIVGLSSANISNVYSNVDIESDLDYVGGIIGQANNNYLYNSLVVGQVYSSYLTSFLHRTSGNTAPNQNNYALATQLVNGYVTESFYGETLTDYSSLLLPITYNTVIKLGDYFDYSQSSSGYLPKLYNLDGLTLLPNQLNNSLPMEDFQIISVDTVKRMADATVLIKIENPSSFDITDIQFDYLNIVNVNKKATQNGQTSIEVVVEPSRYLDTYKLNKIKYIENGVTKEYSKSVKLDLQFYKNIGSFEDWQRIDSKVPENYRLIADLDFQGRVNINTNVVLARLEGIDNGYTIKNLVINKNEASQSLIKIITTSLKNVNFDNITITNTRTSGSYNGIIRLNYANIDNVSFSNITIDAPKMAYSAPIAISRGYHISNVTLDTINIKGTNYTAGFISYASSDGYNDITASNITIVGQNYTGGIIGYKPYMDNSYGGGYYNFHVTNANVRGATYVGGVFGIGSSDNSSISDSTITGTSYVGGFSGQSYFLYTRNVTATNCNVSGTANYIGGVFGQGQYYLYNIFAINTTVTGTLTSTNYVGGILGHSGGYTMYDSGVLNTTVTSYGDNVGGITGYQNDKSIYYSYVYNTTVVGRNNVGGVTGRVQTGNVVNVNVNAYVTATVSNAGAVYGYVANSLTTNANYPIKIYQVMITGGSVTSQTNTGGLIGIVEAPLYNGHFYNNIVATTLTTTNANGSISAGVGSNKEYNFLINNLLVYDKMKINNVNVNMITNNGLIPTNYVTLANLKVQSTYTSKSFTTGRYDFSVLANSKFPLVKSSSGTVINNQVAIDLPTEIITTSLILAPFEIHELPGVETYAVDAAKINLEFSKVDPYTTFEIKSNDKTIINPTTITTRTYTLSYDYNTTIEITLFDGINKTVMTVKPEDLKKEISVYNDKYYYIRNNMIKTNGNSLNGSFINLYLNKALTTDGNIYDLTTNKIIGTVTGVSLDEKTTPLFTFEYENYIIKTYFHYSEVIDENNNLITHEEQYLVKNGRLEIMDSSLPAIKDSMIIDYYGGNVYQTILGNNGIIYNLKAPIKTPTDFVNRNIKYLTNNLLNDDGLIFVLYNDGSVYGFDYRLGTKVFDEQIKEDISVVEYLKQKLTPITSIIDNNTIDEYKELNKLEEKLKNKSVKEVLNPDINNNPEEKTTYVSKYDSLKGKFILYEEKEALTKDDKDITSETDKILANVQLIEFYTGNKIGKTYYNIDGLKIFISVLGAIIISLLLYLRNMKLLKRN